MRLIAALMDLIVSGVDLKQNIRGYILWLLPKSLGGSYCADYSHVGQKPAASVTAGTHTQSNSCIIERTGAPRTRRGNMSMPCWEQRCVQPNSRVIQLCVTQHEAMM